MKNTPMEWSLIDKINFRVHREDANTVVPLGDDAFVFKNFPGYSVICQDMLMEDIHFDLSYFSAEDLGFKALAVNLSDIAAMGARPHYAQVSLALPERLTSSWLDDFYSSMSGLADEYGCRIVGGDLCGSKTGLVIDVSIHGSCETPLTRHGTKPGDLLLSSGPLGLSHTGLLALKNNLSGYEVAKRKHRRPSPRLDMQPLLQIKNKYVHGLIDCSDGLINDALRLCRDNLGFHIFAENLPLHEDTNKLALQLGTSPEDFALWGGEDYELLMTIDPDRYNEFSDWHLIGQVTSEPGVFLTGADHKTEISEFRGWQHFNFFSK